MRRLLLVRHGESHWNVELRIQGQAGSGLSPRGRAQAEHTAAWLADAFPEARLFSSDLQRCLETADAIGGALGREPVTDPGLRERDFGRWTGRLVREVAEADPDWWARWRAGEDVVGALGGEDTTTVAARVAAALQVLLDGTPDGGASICVTHGGPVWHGTRALLGIADGVLGGVGNASITEIVVHPDWGRRLLTWNQVGHLPAALRDVGRPAAGDTEGRAPPVGT